MFFFIDGTPKSWSESLDVCKKSGALCSQRSCVNDLASINNRFELSLIIAHAHSLRKLGFNEFWIGLENFNVSPSCFSTSTKPHEWASFKNTSEFRWVDGWPMRISLWGSNQPNTQIGKKCVKMILNREDDYSQMLGAEWWSADCSEPHPFICKSTTGTGDQSELVKTEPDFG